MPRDARKSSISRLSHLAVDVKEVVDLLVEGAAGLPEASQRLVERDAPSSGVD